MKLQHLTHLEILAPMNPDGLAIPSSAPGADAISATPTPKHRTIELTTHLAIFNHPTRWKLVQMMADGSVMSATEAAAALQRDIDGIIKHLVMLRNCGILNSRASEKDARYLLYYMPDVWRSQPGVLDFGSCVLRLPARRP